MINKISGGVEVVFREMKFMAICMEPSPTVVLKFLIIGHLKKSLSLRPCASNYLTQIPRVITANQAWHYIVLACEARQAGKNIQTQADLDPIILISAAALDSLNSWSSTPDIDKSILSLGDDIACSCDILTLQTIKTMLRYWQKDWASEDLWNTTYEEVLMCAQTQEERETAMFLDECEKHAWEGKSILDSIQDVVKFFEVKLDSSL
ncbi:hypothetical protein EV702DRAFT_1042452 [Suillus placidus]|uniref:Uncharacterized protein n=1 Tax=Suillus placidus TaxID=48579 RepID=A0A9P7D6Z9_9AGAM|nr:hypothetical protein EV702DRAFT_1042452 [Suillus placidus]